MEIETILKDFDNSANVFDYIDVSEALGQCSDEVKGTEEYNAEIIAMNLIEAYSSNDDMFNGKFYFGPHLILQDKMTGLPIEFHNIKEITPQII